MDFVACRGFWKLEEEVLAGRPGEIKICPCPLRQKCNHYQIRNLKMVPFYDVVPITLNEGGLIDHCIDFDPAIFPKEERPNRGGGIEIPPGVV